MKSWHALPSSSPCPWLHIDVSAAVVQRPPELITLPASILEVERERVRLAAAEDIAAAWVGEDGGQNAAATTPCSHLAHPRRPLALLPV